MSAALKSLYLLRHAKSSWKDETLPDMDRPLNKRGRRDAPRMGAALGARFAPMVFHVSPALRAQRTFAGLCEGWRGLSAQHCLTTSALYTFEADDVLRWLGTMDSATDRLALIGHNPALTDVINYLAGVGTLNNLPTAGWVELSVPVARWSEISRSAGQATLDYYLFPKELPDGDAHGEY